MFQHILVPLDGSETAEQAIPLAARIVRASGGSLVLVRVIHALPLNASYGAESAISVAPSAMETQLAHANHYLSTITTTYAAELTNIPVQMDVELGATASGIALAAHVEQADSIIMCSQGKSSLASWVFGGVARQLARHSPVPMLVLNAHAYPSLLSMASCRVTVPLDGSEVAENVLVPLMDFITTFPPMVDLELHLVRVVTSMGMEGGVRAYHDPRMEEGSQDVQEADDYLRIVAADLLKDVPISNKVAITTSVIRNERTVAETIVRHVEHTQDANKGACSQMIAMASHGRSGLKRLLLGSVAESVLSTTKCPVLLVRPSQILHQGETEGLEKRHTTSAMIDA